MEVDEEALLQQLASCKGKPIHLKPKKLWIVVKEGEDVEELVEQARKILDSSYD